MPREEIGGIISTLSRLPLAEKRQPRFSVFPYIPVLNAGLLFSGLAPEKAMLRQKWTALSGRCQEYMDLSFDFVQFGIEVDRLALGESIQGIEVHECR